QEHNYSMFSSGEGLGSLVVKQEEPEASSGSGTSSGSEQEESENEATEEEEEDDDYEEQDADKEASSDYNSESGMSNKNEDDPTARALSEEPARRQKRRYFWEYSRSQSSPTKPGRRLSPAVWDRNMLPSNQYQKENRLSTGKMVLSRNHDSMLDWTTPLWKDEGCLKSINKRNISNQCFCMPIIARPERGKEAELVCRRACRLKKKAQHEANKIKLWGLNQEHEDALLRVIVGIKAEIVRRVGSSEQNDGEKMTEKLEKLLKQMQVSQGPVVAGQTSEFVQKVLERVAAGDPMGGLDKGGMMTSSL
uniref:Uncharacterized protein n=1 Tax=Latimeria chalumnae TaxID=7897 RepID=H3AQT4_LATCH